MANSIRAHLQLASEKEVKDILTIDSKEVSSRPSDFIMDNLLGAYVLINTWLMIIKQWSQYGWISVLNHMVRNGLFKTIALFDSSAAEVIAGDVVTNGLVRQVLRDVEDVRYLQGIPKDTEYRFYDDAMTAKLLICRYAKRFSPLHADKLSDIALQAFIERQRDIRLRPELPWHISKYVKEEVYEILDWESLASEFQSVDVHDMEFTSGVSFDTGAELASKLKFVARQRPEYFYQPFGIPLVSHTNADEARYWGKHLDIEMHPVKLRSVPKSYKTGRIIAPENVIRQGIARRMFTIWDRYLPSEIMLHDQTQNQSLARKGSIDGSYATIDLSAASDSIHWGHIAGWFPPHVVDQLKRVLPTHWVDEGGKLHYLQSAATMGNSITFILESVIFLGIAKAAVKYYNLMSGDTDVTVSVYGDDIIVPSNAAPTVMDWLTLLHFSVNEDKSFWDVNRRYRESCGEEYFEGVRTSSLYFPRFPLEGTFKKLSNKTRFDTYTKCAVDTMTAILDLQRKLYRLCEPASRLLSSIIIDAEPRMTASTPDDPYQDLFEYEARPKTFYAPAAEIIDGKFKRVQVPGMTRDAHLGPIMVYPSAEKEGSVLLDLYKYEHFLRFGPRYEDDLMRLLGITASPRTWEEIAGKPTIKWDYIK